MFRTADSISLFVGIFEAAGGGPPHHLYGVARVPASPQVSGIQAPGAMADEGIVSYPRFRTAALAGALLLCLGGCSNSHIPPSGRVTTADLRAGKLPAAVEVCVTGVATYYDSLAGTLVVQDQAGAMRFDHVNAAIPRFGLQIEVCGETRRAQSGTTLARPYVKVLGNAGLPASKRTSPSEWSRDRKSTRLNSSHLG